MNDSPPLSLFADTLPRFWSPQIHSGSRTISSFLYRLLLNVHKGAQFLVLMRAESRWWSLSSPPDLHNLFLVPHSRHNNEIFLLSALPDSLIFWLFFFSPSFPSTQTRASILTDEHGTIKTKFSSVERGSSRCRGVGGKVECNMKFDKWWRDEMERITKHEMICFVSFMFLFLSAFILIIITTCERVGKFSNWN